MLALLFHIGTERFGLDAGDILEVVPLVELRAMDQSMDFITGEFSYRGVNAPVIDLGKLTGQPPCPHFLSTRIIMVRQAARGDTHRVIGLLAEKVTETVRISPEQFEAAGKTTDEAAFQTPLTLEKFGSVQLLHLERLLPAAVLDMVFEGA